MFLRARVSLLVASCLLVPIALVAQQARGTVPAPKHIAITALPDIRNWSAIASSDDPLPPLDFSVDLDMLAPLGTGEGNAATYFAHFARASGDRVDELANVSTTDIPAIGKAWKSDEPFLIEAQPWVDVATMKFYPDIFKLAGPTTEIPYLLHFMTLGRSWSARAAATSDREAAREDYRRVIRLGRLARQESVTMIQDLIGLALIKMGTSGLYGIARSEGDAATMTVAALAYAEASGMREAIRSRIRDVSVNAGEKVSDAKLDAIVKSSRESAFRPMRFEALNSLYFIANTASKQGRAKAAAAIGTLAADNDPLMAASAKYYQQLKWSPELAAMMPKD